MPKKLNVKEEIVNEQMNVCIFTFMSPENRNRFEDLPCMHSYVSKPLNLNSFLLYFHKKSYFSSFFVG